MVVMLLIVIMLNECRHSRSERIALFEVVVDMLMLMKPWLV
jgi:hypothetical protein